MCYTGRVAATNKKKSIMITTNETLSADKLSTEESLRLAEVLGVMTTGKELTDSQKEEVAGLLAVLYMTMFPK
jgi:hypothetical protein